MFATVIILIMMLPVSDEITSQICAMTYPIQPWEPVLQRFSRLQNQECNEHASTSLTDLSRCPHQLVRQGFSGSLTEAGKMYSRFTRGPQRISFHFPFNKREKEKVTGLFLLTCSALTVCLIASAAKVWSRRHPL